MAELNVAEWLKARYGTDIVGAGSSPDTVKVRIPVEGSAGPETDGEPIMQEKEINWREAFRAREKIDPIALGDTIKFNDVHNPINDSPMGFVDRLKYGWASQQGEENKQRFLTERFGAENVKQSKDGILVNQGGAWHVADATGLSGELGEHGDVMAGAITGGIATASAVAPALAAITAVTGGVASPITIGAGVVATGIGAGVGAMIARYGTKKAAEAAGIRTEQDMADASTEMGKEFVMGFGGEVLPRTALEGGALGIRALGKSAKAIAEKAISPAAQNTMATMLEKMTGVLGDTFKAEWKNPEAVAGFRREMLTWDKSRDVGAGLNPMARGQTEELATGIKEMESRMRSDYRQLSAEIAPVKDKATADIAPVVNDAFTFFQDARLVDNTGRWIGKDNPMFNEGLGPAERNILKKSYDRMMRAVEGATSEGEIRLPWEEAMFLKQDIQSMQARTGFFKLKAGETGATASRGLAEMGVKIDQALVDGLAAHSPEAAAKFQSMNNKYSTARTLLDKLGPMTDQERAHSTLNLLLKGDQTRKGAAYQSMFKEGFDAAGLDGQALMDRLFQRQAAIDTLPWFSKGLQSRATGAALGGALGLAHGHDAKSTAVGMIGGGLLLGPKAMSAMSRNSFNALQKTAHMVEFTGGLSLAERHALLQNPALLSALGQSTMQAIGIEDSLPQQMLQSQGIGQ